MRGLYGTARVLGLLVVTLFTGCAATTGPPQPAFLEPEPAEPIVLAGLMRLDDATAGRWAWSGAWMFPVGDPFEMGAPDPGETSGYRINRGVSKKPRRHDGADLSNQRGGGEVRAAANGIVLRVAGSGGGYGAHVVLAHRLAGGGLAYSVYGHLRPRSFRVAPGEAVAAGRPLGLVGRTGRASSHHLHFEVRLAEDMLAQWQHAEPVDPIAFVSDRLPDARRDTTWAGPYLEWAGFSALVPAGAGPDTYLTRADWWTILSRAARSGPEPVSLEPEMLRGALVEAGLLPVGSRGPSGEPVPWGEAARDLERLGAVGLRLPPCPVDPERHEAALASRPSLGGAHPPDGTPTLADALLALADVSLQRARAGR